MILLSVFPPSMKNLTLERSWRGLKGGRFPRPIFFLTAAVFWQGLIYFFLLTCDYLRFWREARCACKIAAALALYSFLLCNVSPRWIVLGPPTRLGATPWSLGRCSSSWCRDPSLAVFVASPTCCTGSGKMDRKHFGVLMSATHHGRHNPLGNRNSWPVKLKKRWIFPWGVLFFWGKAAS